MPRYRVFLRDQRDVVVEGDKIEIVDNPTNTAESGDVVIRKASRIIAHFSANDMLAYTEVEPDPLGSS